MVRETDSPDLSAGLDFNRFVLLVDGLHVFGLVLAEFVFLSDQFPFRCVDYFVVYSVLFFNAVGKGKAAYFLVFLIVAAAWLLCYIFFVDKSYYHIDTVREPFIRFLFGESMLLGVYFRLNLDRFRNKNKLINWVLLVLSAGIYLATKLAFSKIESISTFQILNQCTLLLVLYLVFRCFAGIDAKLEALPRFIKRILEFIAEITLEIYLVQIGIIPFFAKLLPFPLNWLVLTSVIVAGAAVLHFGTKKLIEALQLLFRKLFRKKAK